MTTEQAASARITTRMEYDIPKWDPSVQCKIVRVSGDIQTPFVYCETHGWSCMNLAHHPLQFTIPSFRATL